MHAGAWLVNLSDVRTAQRCPATPLNNLVQTSVLFGKNRSIAAGYDPCCDWPHGNMNIHAPSVGLG